MRTIVIVFLMIISRPGYTLPDNIRVDTINPSSSLYAADSVPAKNTNTAYQGLAPGLGAAFFGTLGLLIICITFAVILVLVALTLLIFIIMALLGILSTSILVGIKKRSLHSGVKAFLFLLTGTGGLLIGAVIMIAIAMLFSLHLSLLVALLTGSLGGLTGGLLLGLLLYRTYWRLAGWAVHLVEGVVKSE